MSYPRDDLAPLLVPSSGAELTFHAGVVEAWDTETGANTITVAGAALVDVPVLNTSEAISLEPGAVVALLRARHSYFILGRVTMPGSADFAPSAVQTAVADGDESNFSVDAAWDKRAIATVEIPAWANEATVTVFSAIFIANTSGAHSAIEARARVETPTGFAWWGAWSPITLENGTVRAMTAQLARVLPANELGSGLLEFSTEIQRDSGVNIPANINTRIQTTATVIFRRV